MPYCLVIVDWDKIKGPNVKARYPPAEPHYNDDIPMQIFMMHTAKDPPEEQITLNLSGMDVLSQFIQFEQEGTMRRVILLLLLKPEEKPIHFKRKLIIFKDKIIGKMESENINQIVEDYYKENFSMGLEDFSVEGMKKKLIDQAQTLLGKGQTQKARDIIERSERVPRTVFNLIKQADNSLEQEKYSDASQHYEDIVALLTEIEEDEMAGEFAQKSIEIKGIPKLLNQQKDTLNKIRKITKKVNFQELIELITHISKVTNELKQYEKAKGYSDQALALKQYITANPDKEPIESESIEDIILEVVDEEDS